jgi:hypothetical protein
MRPVVAAIQDWLIAEIRSDIAEIDARYPELGIAAVSF